MAAAFISLALGCEQLARVAGVRPELGLGHGVNPCHFVLVRELIQSTGGAHNLSFTDRVPGAVLKAREGGEEHDLFSSRISELSTKLGFPLEKQLKLSPMVGHWCDFCSKKMSTGTVTGDDAVTPASPLLPHLCPPSAIPVSSPATSPSLSPGHHPRALR